MNAFLKFTRNEDGKWVKREDKGKRGLWRIETWLTFLGTSKSASGTPEREGVDIADDYQKGICCFIH